jgi:hypothetical protein
MSPRLIEVRDGVEAAAVEQAPAMARELKRIADAAPDGEVPAAVEQAAVDRGRRFPRERLRDALNAQAAATEQKGGTPGPAPAAGRGGTGAPPTGGWPPPPAT